MFTSVRALPTQSWRIARSLRARALPGLRLGRVVQTVAARVGASVLSFGASVIATRALGPHGRGELAVLIAVPGVIGVMGLLGLDTANLRFAGQSHSAFRQVVRRALVFALGLGTALAAAWWLAGFLWPVVRLGLDPRLALLSAALCPVIFLSTLLGAAEIGRGRTPAYNLVTAGTMVVYLAGVVTLRLAGHLTVVGCFAVFGTSQVLGVITLLVLATKRVHDDGAGIPIRQYGSYALRAYLPNLVQYGMIRMDVPVIQVLAGTTAVALYSVALPFAEALQLLPVSVGLVLFSQVTSGTVNRAATKRIAVAVMITTTALAGAIAVATPLVVPILYGSPYRDSVAVVWSMLPGLVFYSAARTTQTYFSATDNLRPVIVASVAGVIAGLIALFALVSRFGAVGAGAADSVGYTAFAAILLGRLYLKKPSPEGTTPPQRKCRFRALYANTRTVTGFGNVWPAALGFIVIALAIICGALSARSTVRTIEVLDVLVLLLIVAKPRIGIYTLAIVMPVSQTAFGIKLITEKDLLILIIACLAGQLAARRTFPRGLVTAALGITLVCYFFASATLIGGAGIVNEKDIYGMLALGCVLLSIPLIAGPDSITRRATVVFSFSTVYIALVEILTARSSLAASTNISAVNSADLAAGQTGALNHNTEGAFFVLALCVLLALYPQARAGMAKLAVAAGIAALLIGVAYSFSRSSYFGALAVVVVFAMRRSVRGLIGASLVAGCLMPLLPAAILARMSTIWASSNSNVDISGVIRLDLWSSALRMFIHEPVLGVGYLHFAAQLPAYFRNTTTYDFGGNFSTLQYAHETLLTVLSQTGLLGAIMVGAMIVMGWRRAWSAARIGNWVGESSMLAFIGIGVCSAFGEPLFEPALLAAFLLVVMSPRHAEEFRHLEPGGNYAVMNKTQGVFSDA